MFLKKLWYFICAIFFINSFYNAIQDAKSVHNIQVDRFEDEHLNFSVCILLNGEILKKFKVSNFYRFTVKKLVERTCDFFFPKKFCMESIYLKKSYLYNYHSCLSFEINHLNSIMKDLVNKHMLNLTLFVYHDEQSEIYFYQNILGTYTETPRFFDIHLMYHRILLLESPYETDCFNYSSSNLDFKSKEKISSKTSCLLECFKTKSRSLRYYYSTNDDDLIVFNQAELRKLEEIDWKMINSKLLNGEQSDYDYFIQVLNF